LRSNPLGIVLIGLLVLGPFAQSADPSPGEIQDGTSLVLNIYLDPIGRALATGYVEDPSLLPFLLGSQYDYDNQTGQLYALTNSLTSKSGDNWSLNLAAEGSYQGYHAALFLPADAKVRGINLSSGLEYSVSSTSDSLLVDVEGYGVDKPSVLLEWRQPIEPAGPATAPPVPSAFDSYLIPSSLIAALLVGAALFVWRRRLAETRIDNSNEPRTVLSIQDQRETSHPDALSPPNEEQAEPPEDSVVSADVQISDVGPQHSAKADLEDLGGSEPAGPDESVAIDQKDAGADQMRGRIEAEILTARAIGKVPITSEMAAVLNTLTARERAVMTALLEHGGRMTQADIRYETQIPKSSLTGIVISLERRKLVTKKEWGRTNVIELSSWFLSGTEQSGRQDSETERS